MQCNPMKIIMVLKIKSKYILNFEIWMQEIQEWESQIFWWRYKYLKVLANKTGVVAQSISTLKVGCDCRLLFHDSLRVQILSESEFFFMLKLISLERISMWLSFYFVCLIQNWFWRFLPRPFACFTWWKTNVSATFWSNNVLLSSVPFSQLKWFYSILF